MLSPERCKVCLRASGFSFHITDDMWAKVVPEPFRKKVVCLTCFDSFASAKGIAYVEALSP